jgi:hypothetical protein
MVCFAPSPSALAWLNVSYPSLRSYIKTLRGLLKRKSSWLAQESMALADLCLAYGTLAGLTEREKKTLFIAAYFKNLGAVFLNNLVLEQKFDSYPQVQAHLGSWFQESAELAREAGLAEVAVILEQYHPRTVPEDKLAKIFQVLNAWVSCRHPKAWRAPMGEEETLAALEERAQLQWSDAYTVYHFVEYFRQPTSQVGAAGSSQA